MKQTNAGFTIMEVAAVSFIGIVLGLLALPNLARMREVYRLRGVSQEVYSALQQARMSAIKENHNYRFYLVGTTYYLHNDVNNNGAQDAGESVTQRNVQGDAKGVTLAGVAANAPIVFAPNGTATSTGTVTVQNTLGSNTVNVSPAGRVRIN
jgi:Tfp pilus assembly protein FimT